MSNQRVAVDVVDAMMVEFENGALGTVNGTGNLGKSNGIKFAIQVHAGEEVLNNYPPPANETFEYQHYVTSHNLVNLILDRAKNGSPAEIGWGVVKLLDAAYCSAEQDGKAIWINDLYHNHNYQS